MHKSFGAVLRGDPLHTKIFRKEKLSPGGDHKGRPSSHKGGKEGGAGTSFFAPLRGSLTVEAAVAVPVFVICICTLLQFISVMGSASAMGSALAQTAEEMAAGAYFTSAGETDGFLGSALSLGFAEMRFSALAGKTGNVQNRNLLLSSIPDDRGAVDLVLTYRAKPAAGGITLPFIVFVQRGRVRTWTGREQGASSAGEEGGEETEHVYVTEFGTVYHTDPDCSHIRLHIITTDSGQVGSLRNEYGGKYKPCEHCGGGSGTVYITTDGDRYHSSLGCSGLKRTVRELTPEEAAGLPPCSRCAGG